MCFKAHRVLSGIEMICSCPAKWKKSQQLGALTFQEALHPVLVRNRLTSSAFVPLHFISFL